MRIPNDKRVKRAQKNAQIRISPIKYQNQENVVQNHTETEDKEKSEYIEFSDIWEKREETQNEAFKEVIIWSNQRLQNDTKSIEASD